MWMALIAGASSLPHQGRCWWVVGGCWFGGERVVPLCGAALVTVAVSLGWPGVGRGLGLVRAGLDGGVDTGEFGEGG